MIVEPTQKTEIIIINQKKPEKFSKSLSGFLTHLISKPLTREELEKKQMDILSKIENLSKILEIEENPSKKQLSITNKKLITLKAKSEKIASQLEKHQKKNSEFKKELSPKTKKLPDIEDGEWTINSKGEVEEITNEELDEHKMIILAKSHNLIPAARTPSHTNSANNYFQTEEKTNF